MKYRITGGLIVRFVLFILLLLSVACGPAAKNKPQYASEWMQAVLWAQHSGEYAGTTLQAYQAARANVKAALADSTWTALGFLPESFDCSAKPLQTDVALYAALPPAIIVDIDDTVLDNTAFQARLILEDINFDRRKWAEWTDEAQAPAVPGALEFLTWAAKDMGIEIVYVTNRRKPVEEATRANLRALGFPMDPIHDTEFAAKYDLVLTRGDYDSEASSDKNERRRLVANSYRILMLFGDNLGDFLPCVDKFPVADQRQAALASSDMWGTKWFVFPNPVYGIWEPKAGDPDKRRKLKLEMLRTLD
jgi:acid phosphatase